MHVTYLSWVYSTRGVIIHLSISKAVKFTSTSILLCVNHLHKKELHIFLFLFLLEEVIPARVLQERYYNNIGTVHAYFTKCTLPYYVQKDYTYKNKKAFFACSCSQRVAVTDIHLTGVLRNVHFENPMSLVCTT